jgi:hypothetical protein
MTQLLEKAFAEAAKLPDSQQNRLAQWLWRKHNKMVIITLT